jgi:two-component system, chemotaxis family, CheB/CheR fusion protein
VTEFFRDPELFDYLKAEVLPELIEEAREEENQLRIWSAGCATGEEAYSLAILVSEALGQEAGLFNVRILATDIDEDAVKFARRGLYPPSALKGLSVEQIRRYFVEEDGSYQVKKQIRGMIVFGEHDLAQRSPFPNVDLVVSRNVLIYFSNELQRRALQLFAYSLRDGGYLVMGKAESPSLLADLFAPVDRHNKVYRRHGERFLLPPTLPTSLTPRARLERSSGGQNVLRGQPEAQQQLTLASRIVDGDLISQLPVGVAVVARDYTIEAINAAARRMLSIPSVGVGQDFLHAMQEAPYAEVRRAIDETFREGRTTQADEFAVEEATTGEPNYLRLNCYPRRTEAEGQRVRSVIVTVEDVTAAVRIRRLTEKNLRLEEANRNLGQLNEELQAAHEESLVNTEEAQAAAEEVETLNEELQATVEELNTTNDDLQARATERQLTEAARQRAEDLVEQLQSERSRLEAIVVNISDAVLAVDTDGQVLFSNQVFGETFGEHTGAEQNPLGSREVLDESGEELPSESTPASRAAGRESFAMRFAVRGQEGALRRFEARGRPIQGDGVTGGVLVIREVTNG